MAGVNYYNIQQIPNIEEDLKMITIGTIISICKQQKFLSFVISDSTASAQATYYQRKLQYQKSQLPKIGDTIQVLGTCLTKPFANQKKKLFLKIRLDRWRVLTFDEELQIMQKIMTSRKWRNQKKLRDEVVEIRKKVPIKQKQFSQQQMVDIRSLIFSHCYIFFLNNKDIQIYVFTVLNIKVHPICKQYAKQNQIPDKSMQQGIKRALSYLLRPVTASQISLNNPQQYVIKRKYFLRLIVDIQEYVFSKSQTGTTLQHVTKAMNQKASKYNEQDFLFNWKFIQKVLQDLITQFRIYKTSDKKLYPYNC